jgi:hypothetical protein
MLEGSGTIYFTLDGSDPRLPNGLVADNAIAYSGPISIQGRTTIRARQWVNGKWSASDESKYVVGAAPADVANLRITEVNFHPHAALTRFGEPGVDSDEFEFIELANIGTQPVELAEVRFARQLRQGVSFEFGSQILEPGERIVVPHDRNAFVARYGADVRLARGESPFVDDWVLEGNLGNDGDTITLVDARGVPIHRFAYGNRGVWPERADGRGSSLEITDPRGNYSDPHNWHASSQFGGTPGVDAPQFQPRIVVNEVLVDDVSGRLTAIEVHNLTNEATDIGHWYLSDSTADYFKIQVPASARVAGQGYVVVDLTESLVPLNLSRENEVYLIEADYAGRPLGFADIVRFSLPEGASSAGRRPDGTGDLYTLKYYTPAAPNSGLWISDVVISEILYHAEPPEGAFDFVELYNRTNHAVDISGWRLQGDVQFTFATSVVLEAGEVLAVVGFDPDDERSATVFRLMFQLKNPVKLAGPYNGRLNDRKGLVELARPRDVPDDSAAEYQTVDSVPYESVAPWPENLAITRQSLTRLALAGYSRFAINWTADDSSPGVVRTGDVDGDGRITATDIDKACDAVIRQDTGKIFDVNRDKKVDLTDVEYLVRDILGTSVGDADLNGVFDSTDLVAAFQAGQFENGAAGRATWATGDWNCDGHFTTTDLVMAFAAAAYKPD